MTAKEIRQAFLDFFAAKGHVIVPSAPIVVKNDPTLMFTNAGMNQFKDVFLGEAPAKAPRVADTQRCLRVSGKHNDLEEVGIDTYHHTMFEMLGNWSFGDYFKKEAIAWSWELLTEVYKLDKSRLYVTYFEGDEKEGLEKDTETYDLWKQYVPEDRILPGNKKDNFWEMGETGPCGPCSEIHFDGRSEEDRAKNRGAELVNADDPNVIEIWNNVFMQFNRVWDEEKGGINGLVADVEEYSIDYKNKGNDSSVLIDPKKYRQNKAVEYSKLVELPNKHVDTGMGFERLVRVLQGKTSNYDTDVFQPMIQFIAQKSGKKYNSKALPPGEGLGGAADWADAVAMRVLADHIRAISFAIADGQLPASNKAGYVIRRILRRAVRYSYQTLGFKEPFFNELVPLLAEQFKGVFDELYAQKDFVQKVILEEEVAFLRTLASGIKKFEEFTSYSRTYNSAVLHADADLSQTLKHILKGEFAFELSDTYGFPIDLTELLAREIGWTVDIEGFNQALQTQKLRSRAATAVSAGDWVVLRGGDNTEFVGYDEMYTDCEILKYRKVSAQGKEQYQIVLNRTPFYAEGGGQVGDTGNLMSEWYDETKGNLTFEVTDTKKENGLIIHYANLQPYYSLETGEPKEWELPNPMPTRFQAAINMGNRIMTNANHSATHLLHAALKETLGEHVNQKGSLVNPEQLRFDFSHFQKVTDDEIEVLERIVNQKVREAIPLKDERRVRYAEAIERGVTALFGEKYGDYVRMVTFDDNFSKELCGGTHVQNTAEIGFFKITGESAVAAGVRRIEAITSYHSLNYIQEEGRLVKNLKELLRNPADLSKSVESLIEENNRMKKELEKAVMLRASGLKDQLAKTAENINGINFIAQKVELPTADAIKNLAYNLKDIVSNLFLVLAANINGKPSITVMIDEALVKEKGLHAGNIVKELAKEVKGGGGGQPFFATAGGSDVNGIDNVLAKAKSFIQ